MTLGFVLMADNKSPLPASLKQQISFLAIYPTVTDKLSVDQTSLSYQSAAKTLTFTANYKDTAIIVSEQSAPGDTTNPDLVYYQSLGLHPVTEIQTKPGLAVIVNFYTAGNFDSVGQNAILAKDGTLVIAHPDSNLSPTSWKDFFNNFRIYK